MQNINEFIKCFEKSSQKQKIKLLESLYLDEAIELLPYLFRVLENDEVDIELKIFIAQYLGASKIHEAVPVLFKLVFNPKYDYTKGSFLYVLKDLDCSKYFIDVVELMCTGVFEVYYHSYEIFMLTVGKVSEEDKLSAKEILTKQQVIEENNKKQKDRFSRINYINVALKQLN